MLVLVTNREDLTADWLVIELTRRGTPFFRLNTEDYPTRVTLRWTPEYSDLEIGERTLAASEIRAVWWRRPVLPNLPGSVQEREALWASGEALAAIDGFWRSVDAHWVNSPGANVAAECKPDQLRRATALGFDVPASLVSNDPVAVRTFAAEHEQVVCKTLYESVVPTGRGYGVFYTERLDYDDLISLDDLGPEPYLFQELVDKAHDIRVTVIGDEAFACRIEDRSQGPFVDWRKAGSDHLTHTPIQLPSEVACRCLEIAHGYGLRFAAIDLARRQDGRYTFFELNPNGQWAWLQQLTGLPLAAALADELMGV